MCLTDEPRGEHFPACAVIVARGGSKRLVNKNIRQVGGKPVLVRAIEACRACRDIGLVIVSTDSEDYARIAEAEAAHVVRRPEKLAADTSRIDEAAQHAVIETFESGYPHWTAIVQPNIPLWEPGTMDRVIGRVLRGDCTAAVTAHPIHERPEWAMRLAGGYLHRMQPNPVPVNSQQCSGTIFHVDGQVVCVQTRTLLSQFTRQYLGPCGPRIALVEHDRVWGTDVDTIYDLKAARAIHEHLRTEGKL
jgi:CMP-N-acetylneuraminic acid synthetase